MKIKQLSILGSLLMVVVLVSLLVFAGCQPAAPAKVYEWKIQSLWPRGDLSMLALPDFAANVEQRSNGRLKLAVFAEPEIVPADQLFQAVGTGTIEIAQGGGFWAMILPVADVEFGLAQMWSTSSGETFEEGAVRQRDFFFEGGFVDVLRPEYAKNNLYYLDLHTYGPSCCLVTKPVGTQADLKGLKLADTGGYQSVWHEMLGWAPSPGFAGADVYMALKLGTLDACMWDLSAITGLHWNEVAPNWVSNEGFTDYATGNMIVNLDAWNELPDDLKGVLEDAAKDYWQDTVDIYGQQLAIVRQMLTDGTLNESVMDAAYLQAAQAAAIEVWDMAAEADPASAEAIALIKEWKGIQ